jgi:hypothetical protein
MLQSEQLLKLLAATQALHAQALQHTCLTGTSNDSSSSSDSSTAATTTTQPDLASSAAAEDVLRAAGLSWVHSDAALFADTSAAPSSESEGEDGDGGKLKFRLRDVSSDVPHNAPSP